MMIIIKDEKNNRWDVVKKNEHGLIIKSFEIPMSDATEEEVQDMINDENSDVYKWLNE